MPISPAGRWLARAMIALTPVGVGVANAQQPPMTYEEAIAALDQPIEGFGHISVSHKIRVLGDSGALSLYYDLLMARRPWPARADTGIALCWLMTSRQPRFLPAFLRYAVAGTDKLPSNSYSCAVGGLVALASNPVAAARLRTLTAARVLPVYRLWVVRPLMAENTVASRDLLAHAATSDFPPSLQAQIATTLRTPARP
jgi:hypothetical protein